MVYSSFPRFALIVAHCHPCEVKSANTAVFDQMYESEWRAPLPTLLKRSLQNLACGSDQLLYFGGRERTERERGKKRGMV